MLAAAGVRDDGRSRARHGAWWSLSGIARGTAVRRGSGIAGAHRAGRAEQVDLAQRAAPRGRCQAALPDIWRERAGPSLPPSCVVATCCSCSAGGFFNRTAVLTQGLPPVRGNNERSLRCYAPERGRPGFALGGLGGAGAYGSGFLKAARQAQVPSQRKPGSSPEGMRIQITSRTRPATAWSRSGRGVAMSWAAAAVLGEPAAGSAAGQADHGHHDRAGLLLRVRPLLRRAGAG